MDLKANFPSAIPEPTEEELAQVLVEFHQRGRLEVKALAPPPPFEITSNVVQTQPATREVVKRDDPPMVPPSQQPVMFEDEVDFYRGDVGNFNEATKIIYFSFTFRAHNEGKIVRGPCFIRTYNASFEAYPPTPGGGNTTVRGPVYPSFNGTTWTPPAPNQPPISVVVGCFCPQMPRRTATYIAAVIAVPMFVEYEDDGTDMEHIYGNNAVPRLFEWYNAPPRSIIAQIYFVY